MTTNERGEEQNAASGERQLQPCTKALVESPTMEVAIPDGAYVGPPTAFGGYSLESVAEDYWINYAQTEGAVLKVDWLPSIMEAAMDGLVGRLAIVRNQKRHMTLAFVHRLLMAVGLSVIQEIADRYPEIAERRRQAIMTRNTLDLVDMPERKFTMNLGPVGKKKNPTIYANNPEEVIIVQAMAQNLGLAAQTIAKLCLVAGLAQSIDPAWVRADWRRLFIREVRRFDTRLAEWSRQ